MHYTESKKESVDYVNELLVKFGQEPIEDGEADDWGLIGGESSTKLEILVKDFISELRTEKCQAKTDWMYEL